MSLDLSTTLPLSPSKPLLLRDRVCARLGGFCDLLRRAHAARIPF
jgi:hypothetical protein